MSLLLPESPAELIKMDDGIRLATWSAGQPSDGAPSLVMVHGGPGLRDYLGPVAAEVADLCRVHRYDQRGTGESPWDGEHTIARHIRDLELLLDAWGYSRAVLVGHSFGTDLASFFLLAHPERVAGIIYLSGPFLGPWREPTHATEVSRRSRSNSHALRRLEQPPSVPTPRRSNSSLCRGSPITLTSSGPWPGRTTQPRSGDRSTTR